MSTYFDGQYFSGDYYAGLNLPASQQFWPLISVIDLDDMVAMSVEEGTGVLNTNAIVSLVKYASQN